MALWLTVIFYVDLLVGDGGSPFVDVWGVVLERESGDGLI